MSISSDTNSIPKKKDRLRHTAKQWRGNLTRHEVLQFSRKVSEKLEKYDFSGVKNIHCYLPIVRNNEIDTLLFLAWLYSEYPLINVFTPVFNSGDSSKTDYVQITPRTQYKTDRSGFLVPLNAVASQLIAFDLIIVPTLLTDISQHRLGYGGGYYDRFLAHQPNSETIGVGYKNLQVDALPVELHDVKLKKLILV